MKKVLLLIIGLIVLSGCGKNKEVKDYYIYITDSELATVYTLLDLVSNDDKSYIWYTDTSLINVNYLNTDKNVKLSSYIGNFDKGIVDEINEFIKDNKKNGRFHLVLDEKYYLLEFALDLKDNYDVKILSSGVDSYNNYYDYQFEDGYDIYKKYEEEFNDLKNNFNIDKEYDHNYILISAKRDNVKYYLQYPEYLAAYDDKVKEEYKKINFVTEDPKTIYNKLTMDMQNELLKIIGLDKKDYDNKYFGTNKPKLVIIGGNGKYKQDGMEDILKQVYDKYKDSYTILYKSHEDYVLKENQIEYLTSLNINILPSEVPMEIISFIYSDLKIGGFPSELLLNTKTEDVLFLFVKDSKDLESPFNKIINETHKIEYITPILKEATSAIW